MGAGVRQAHLNLATALRTGKNFGRRADLGCVRWGLRKQTALVLQRAPCLPPKTARKLAMNDLVTLEEMVGAEPRGSAICCQG